MTVSSDTLQDRTDGTNWPRASIIIAAKDAGAFIADALRSALAQTVQDIEIIVVDDGSVDDPSDVVRASANGDPRLRLLRNESSQGVSSARNRAIGMARGAWIAVLDSDDQFVTDRLERMIGAATARGLDLLGDNLALRDFATKAPLGRAYPSELMSRSEPITLADLLERDVPGLDHRMIGYLKPIMRRTFLEEHGLSYREDVWCAEDFLLYAEAILAGGRFGLIDDTLYVYSERRGSASQSSSHPAVNVEVARVNRIVGQLARARGPGFDRAVRTRQAHLNYFAFVQLLKNLEVRKAGAMLLRVPIGYLAKSATAAAMRRLRRRAG